MCMDSGCTLSVGCDIVESERNLKSARVCNWFLG